MSIKITNNAASQITSNISDSDTVFNVLPGHGVRFPALTNGDWHPATLLKETGEIEIIKVTGRSTDTLTVVRGQEGTAPLSFLAGDRIELRLTASSYIELLPTGFGPLPWSRPNPPTGWIWSDGRILLADTPYPALRAIYIADGFPFGQDGSGNPKIPDMRGRTAAGLDDLGGVAAGRLTGASLGAGLGAQTHTLSAAEMPAHAHGVNDPTHAHGITDPGHSHVMNKGSSTSAGAHIGKASSIDTVTSSGMQHTGTGISINGSATGISIQSAGSGEAHNNVQPTLALTWIVKT